MKIGPLPPNRPAQTGETAPMRTKKTAEPEAGAKDRVEVSSDARMKLAEAADEARREIVSGAKQREPEPQTNDLAGTDRIARLRERVKSGYYERPEVRAQIVDNLADDIKP